MDNIIAYLIEKYSPLSIIVYGSYADGTNGPGSDFDALLISADCVKSHDRSFVNGVQLDVFVYPASFFEETYDCATFLRIHDGIIIRDSQGLASTLKERVSAYLESRPVKSADEIQDGIDWCIKMCERVKRPDAEGMFRWHWLLTDSLEIFCDALHHPYMGPKKALKWMEKEHAAAFALYEKALTELSHENLQAWVRYIKNMNI